MATHGYVYTSVSFSLRLLGTVYNNIGLSLYAIRISSSVKMPPDLLSVGDVRVKDIDKACKNKFRWPWLDEVVDLGAGIGKVKIGDAFHKMAKAAHALCSAKIVICFVVVFFLYNLHNVGHCGACLYYCTQVP